MIVKNEFLERRRIEFAIDAKFKRHLCHSIGLTGGVDPKSVRFTLGDTHHGVEKRRNEKKQCAETQRQQRESGWIGYTSHAPSVAPAPDGCVKQNSSEPESDEHENSEV